MHDGLLVPPPVDSTFTVRSVRPEDLPILIGMYIACFAEAPWLEVFTPEEVREDFEHILAMKQNVFLVVCQTPPLASSPCQGGTEGVLGAAIGFPVAEKPPVQADLPTEDRESFYVAEIFVDRSRRNRLLSLAVTTQLLAAARAIGFDRYSVRTSIDQPRIIRLFTDHFEATEVGRQEVTSMKNIDGAMREMPDTRVIMSGPIR